jgi:RimJ/RimL family protein N-acetyltransferase
MRATQVHYLPVSLRRAAPADCARVWEWSFAPDVRALSRSNRPVPLDEHRRWYERRLAEPSPIWVVEEGGAPIGVLRLDHDPGILDRAALISIALDTRARGRGLGRRAISAACQAWGGPIIAEIHVANTPSRIAFEACGFVPLFQAGSMTTYYWSP